jgi:hypothetical protein
VFYELGFGEIGEMEWRFLFFVKLCAACALINGVCMDHPAQRAEEVPFILNNFQPCFTLVSDVPILCRTGVKLTSKWG